MTQERTRRQIWAEALTAIGIIGLLCAVTVQAYGAIDAQARSTTLQR